MDALTWRVIRHALIYGGVLSTVLAALLLAVLRINPELLLNDYPPDIRTRFGPMSERSKRQRIPVAVLMGVVTLVIVIASFSTIRTNGGGSIPFRTAPIATSGQSINSKSTTLNTVNITNRSDRV